MWRRQGVWILSGGALYDADSPRENPIKQMLINMIVRDNAACILLKTLASKTLWAGLDYTIVTCQVVVQYNHAKYASLSVPRNQVKACKDDSCCDFHCPHKTSGCQTKVNITLNNPLPSTAIGNGLFLAHCMWNLVVPHPPKNNKKKRKTKVLRIVLYFWKKKKYS